jgi:hypothetical protein
MNNLEIENEIIARVIQSSPEDWKERTPPHHFLTLRGNLLAKYHARQLFMYLLTEMVERTVYVLPSHSVADFIIDKWKK